MDEELEGGAAGGEEADGEGAAVDDEADKEEGCRCFLAHGRMLTRGAPKRK